MREHRLLKTSGIEVAIECGWFTFVAAVLLDGTATVFADSCVRWWHLTVHDGLFVAITVLTHGHWKNELQMRYR